MSTWLDPARDGALLLALLLIVGSTALGIVALFLWRIWRELAGLNKEMDRLLVNNERITDLTDRQTTITAKALQQATPGPADDLDGALARFYMGIVGTRNSEWIEKVEELRLALAQPLLDVRQVLELQAYFAGRPGQAQRLSAVFFAHPVLLDRLTAAMTHRGDLP